MTMRIGVPKETVAGERRVGLAPDTVARFTRQGIEIAIERGAGEEAHFADAAYQAAGASIVSDAFGGMAMVVKVQRPTLEQARLLEPGSALACFLQPASSADLLALLAERNITALAMEKVPRIARAQSMDALSSQATISGYQAVLLGATAMSRVVPMLITAAGTLAPAKAFILGAGVAGLQAIATARRLGAVVSAFDVRPAVKEQVESLGASFVAVEQVAKKELEAAGGYAKELAAAEQQAVLDAVGRHLPAMDLVISTAQIPGRPAPRLITGAMVATMKPGSVIVDLAAETGGNCEITRPGETFQANGVRVLGPLNLPGTIPLHASQMYSRNLQALLDHLLKDGRLVFDLADAITGAMVVTHQGGIR